MTDLLSQVGRGDRYVPDDRDWQGVQLQDEISLGDLRHAKSGDDPAHFNSLFIPALLIASDYSQNDGGLVRANYNVWRDTFASTQGILWFNVYGDYSAFGVAIRDIVPSIARGVAIRNVNPDPALDDDVIDAAEQMIEWIEGLDDAAYLPGAEDEETELRMRLEQEQWLEDSGELVDRLNEMFENFGVVQHLPEGDYERPNVLPDIADPKRLASVYYGLGDMFGVYPAFEGSGDNLSVIWYFDEFVNKLKHALSPWTLVGGDTNAFADELYIAIRRHVTDDLDKTRFEYGSPIYTALRYGHDARTPAQQAVLRDRIMELTPMRALELAYKGLLLDTRYARYASWR